MIWVGGYDDDVYADFADMHNGEYKWEIDVVVGGWTQLLVVGRVNTEYVFWIFSRDSILLWFYIQTYMA